MCSFWEKKEVNSGMGQKAQLLVPVLFLEFLCVSMQILTLKEVSAFEPLSLWRQATEYCMGTFLVLNINV